MSQKTICQALLDTVATHGDSIACQAHVSDKWVSYTWSEYFRFIELCAAALQKVGVGPQTRVGIFANTRMEWAVTDWAVMGLKAITIPIYQSITPEDLLFILTNAKVEVLFCENERLYSKVAAIRSQLPNLKTIILYDPSTEADGIFSWSHFLDEGREHQRVHGFELSPSMRETVVDDIATIIYTSGTTGQPKGVVVTHQQIFSEVGEAFPLLGVTSLDQSLTFLPYAHVMGRIEHWGHGLIGFKMAFAPSVERIREYMTEIRPTLLIAVPRLFEKIYSGILSQVQAHPVRKRLFDWAFKVGLEVSKNHVEGKTTSLATLAQYRVAHELVFKNISEKLGGRLRFAVSGGAPLSGELAQFYNALGILLLEGYGLTETTAAICVNTPFDYKFGSVGKPFGDVKIKIAEDGEILVQSKKIMKEYYNDSVATAATLQDGWFHTGDIGEFDERGFLSITDRKKDLIKTAGGKYVAPQRLEAMLKTSPLISQVLVYGDQKKFVTVLLTLNHDALKQSATVLGLGNEDVRSPSQSVKLREILRKHISQVNSRLASFESIKNFAILDREFTIDSGELTPSLKVKRKAVTTKYQDLLESLY